MLNKVLSASFTPTADFNGDAWFDYRVSDGQGGIKRVQNSASAIAEALATIERELTYVQP